MNIISNFIQEYKENFSLKIDNNFNQNLTKILHELILDKYSPSLELKKTLLKLQRRLQEPMKVAIVGQFSSGKSTFLNALLGINILPTGITPVTSKVNYIRYGTNFSIKVRFLDGRDEFHDTNTLKKFTDQREDVEDIKFLTLYAPLELLKDVVFVDTPGLNSQSMADTNETTKVLNEVDGIIWLSLIDNAGKQSEAEILEQFLQKHKNKSLCVLNQKDKFSEEQVENTKNYIKNSFSKYFADVVPISAKMALEAKALSKNAKLDTIYNEFLRNIKENFKNENFLNILESKTKELKIQEKKIQEEKNDTFEMLENSNILKVISFINQEIQPIANTTKQSVIKQDLILICNILISQYEYFIQIYHELQSIIIEFNKNSNKAFESLKIRFSNDLKQAYLKIEEIIDKIANEIYSQVGHEEKVRFIKAKTSFFNKAQLYEKVLYQVSKINADNIYKKLFFDDNLIGKMFKQYVKNLEKIKDELNYENEKLYETLEKKLKVWQSKYEIKRKDETLHSDIEFGNLRRFASKAYEHFLKSYNDEIKFSFAQISSKFNHLSSAVNFNYQNATEVCVAHIQNKIAQSIKLFEENPTDFSVYEPKISDIKVKLVNAFFLYELENLIGEKNTFTNKHYDTLMKNFETITNEKIKFLQMSQKIFEEKILSLKNLINLTSNF